MPSLKLKLSGSQSGEEGPSKKRARLEDSSAANSPLVHEISDTSDSDEAYNDREDLEDAYVSSGDDDSADEYRIDSFKPVASSKGKGKASGGPQRSAFPRRKAVKTSGASTPTLVNDDGSRYTHNLAHTSPQSGDIASAIFDATDFSTLPLKTDHAFRPLYISPATRTIILEAFHSLAQQAQDFLVAIAEPVSRPSHMHEYKLTAHSLYAAVSVGLETNDIVEVLNRLSKVPVPLEIVDFIRHRTDSYGKVKLVLKQNKYYVESAHPDTLRMLLKDPVIGAARMVLGEGDDAQEVAMESGKAPSKAGLVIPGTSEALKQQQQQSGQAQNGDLSASASATKPNDSANKTAEQQAQDDYALFSAVVGLDREDELDDDDNVHAFEIRPTEIEDVKRQAVAIEYPMLEEYDFRNDTINANLDIDLKPTTMIRPYQEKSLSKMFGNGRARSGIIVLPCGSGKTLVGITAACTIKKSCLILCTSNVSVQQWKNEFLRWSTIQDRQIAVFTADQKEKFIGDSGIVVSTYSMVANRQKRSHDAAKMMEFLTSREWGFILLDEVHVVPAAMFRRVVTTIKAHAKLGLTATLVREDDKIDDLNFLIGPKLYEANWMDLAKDGHIASVQCAEVWCPMTAEFYSEYLREKSRKKMLLYAMNPRKFQACQFLIRYHEDRGDKIIVFSDNVFALEAYAKKLKKLYIHGGTAQVERMRILQNFQHNPLVNCIFLSKVGDTSIDLPEATCLIQISSHFGSRRQEAQRLGRILRAKRRNDEGFNAFFYSLVSRDTEEMYYSTKRQQFLIDQGYAFRVITHLDGMENLPDLVYPSKQEQVELLGTVLSQNESAADLGTDIRGHADDLPGDITSNHFGRPATANGTGKKKGAAAPAKRVQGSLNTLSGASEMSYVETNRSANKQLAKDSRHKIFKKRDAMRKEKAKAQNQ